MEKTGIEVRIVAVGTGQALKNARNGDGDVVLVATRVREFWRDNQNQAQGNAEIIADATRKTLAARKAIVPVKLEPALIDAFQQHHAGRRAALRGRSRQRHRLRGRQPGRARLLEPALELPQRVGVEVALVHCANLPGA